MLNHLSIQDEHNNKEMFHDINEEQTYKNFIEKVPMTNNNNTFQTMNNHPMKPISNNYGYGNMIPNEMNFYNPSPQNEVDPYYMMSQNRMNNNVFMNPNFMYNQMNPYQLDPYGMMSNMYGMGMNMNPYMNNRPNNTFMMNSQKGKLRNNNNPIQGNSFVKKNIMFDSQSFDDIYNSIPDICKDHTGSKLFQKVYEEGTAEQQQKLLNKLMPDVYLLSKDVFGNYVIQRLLEIVSIDNRKLMIAQLYNRIKELTLHMYGCRVIQKAISVGDIEDVRRHLFELQNDLIKCVQDQNGNHVIQKLIEKLPQGEHKEIINTLKGRVYQISIHQYGCRVIQRIFEYCLPNEKDVILQEIYERIHELCKDQYGNYVIQNIVEKIKENDTIFTSLKGKVYEYSRHKFASNVIEKCLALGKKGQIDAMVKEIIDLDDKNNEVLTTLVKDKYGNYVVQKMIEMGDIKLKEILIRKISKTQALKRKDGFAKHVIGLIEKMGLTSFIDQSSQDTFMNKSKKY